MGSWPWTRRRYADALRAGGIHVDVFQYPAVPVGESRLLFMLNAGHTAEQIDRVADVLSTLRTPA